MLPLEIAMRYNARRDREIYKGEKSIQSVWLLIQAVACNLLRDRKILSPKYYYLLYPTLDLDEDIHNKFRYGEQATVTIAIIGRVC